MSNNSYMNTYMREEQDDKVLLGKNDYHDSLILFILEVFPSQYSQVLAQRGVFDSLIIVVFTL